MLVGNDVWIGARAMLLDGVRVGDGAIVGAGAVVTRDVPPYAIVVGSPAKVVRFRFDDARIARLLQLSWWLWSDELIRQRVEAFSNVETFLTMCANDEPADR